MVNEPSVFELSRFDCIFFFAKCMLLVPYMMMDSFERMIFGLILYNRAIVYKCLKILKVVVHVIITDQCNQTAHETKSS